MPRVTFIGDFNWTDPRLPGVTTAYLKGMTLLVTTPCAQEAIGKSRAVPFEGKHADSIDRR